jgi:hypothetical protein
MTNSKMIELAIDESIYNNKIVHIEHTSELEEELIILCDDYLDVYSSEGGYLTHFDFWGTDDDGKEWRIYLDYPV